MLVSIDNQNLDNMVLVFGDKGEVYLCFDELLSDKINGDDVILTTLNVMEVERETPHL